MILFGNEKEQLRGFLQLRNSFIIRFYAIKIGNSFIIRFYAIIYRATIVQIKIISSICSCLIFVWLIFIGLV